MRTAVLLAVLSFRAAAQDPAPCAIGGTVVDASGEKPLARARVIAEIPRAYSLVRFSDERGAFCFEQLAPAAYRIWVQKPGYVGILYSTTLAVEENAVVKPLELRMERYAGISGAVLDADGAPLPGVEVTVYERKRVRNGSEPDAVDSVHSGGDGEFHFSEPPGTYYLSARREDGVEPELVIPFANNFGQMPREKEVETFYSGSFTFADATPLELKAGQQVDNLVLGVKKARLRRLTGRIAGSTQRAFLSYETASESRSDSFGAIPVSSDGAFGKAGLLPAKYRLWLRDGQKLIAHADVDLTLGDALGIELDPIETVDVPVTFRTEGKGPVFHLGPPVILRGADEAEGSVLQASGGAYHFPSVARGVYHFVIDLAGQHLYLKSLAYGGEPQTADTVDLRTVRPGGLEVTLSPNVAEMHGKVTAAEEETGDLRVVLVEEARSGDAQRIAFQADTDQKGRFRMTGLAPGKYRLFAIQGFDAGAWGTALEKLLEEKSLELEVRENDKKQVTVSAISAAEWEAAVKKAGG